MSQAISALPWPRRRRTGPNPEITLAPLLKIPKIKLWEWRQFQRKLNSHLMQGKCMFGFNAEFEAGA
jgi:hypothetical protein